jgi:hypothetical protein
MMLLLLLRTAGPVVRAAEPIKLWWRSFVAFMLINHKVAKLVPTADDEIKKYPLLAARPARRRPFG